MIPGTLASAMLDAFTSQAKQGESFLRTSIPSIDEVLGGGFRPSEIVSIAGENATDRTLIALHLVSSVLLADEHHEIVFIDTSGTFDPHHLLRVCANCIQVQKLPGADNRSEEMDSFRHFRLLERVQLMRVFDDAGIIDALREVQHACSTPPQQSETLEQRLESNDSSRMGQGCGNSPSGTPTSKFDQTSRIRLVVIDNIANIIAPQMSKNQLHGQAILASCGRYLGAIAHSSRTSVLVLNSATNRANDTTENEGVSTFQSVLNRPSLGRGFTRFVDLSTLISTPMEASDTSESSMDASKVRVLEILKDRHGSRAGGWAVF